MRKLIIVTSLLLSSACLVSGQKYRMGQTPPPVPTFPIRVHISASHLRLHCSGGESVCGYDLYADATLDHKRVELWGSSKIGNEHWSLIAPGDYKAELTQDIHNIDQSVFSRHYILRLPDGTLWPCQLSGIAE